MSEHASPDHALLAAVLERDGLSDDRRAIFEDMLQKLQTYGRPLTKKQRDFAKAALEGEKYEPEPEYENLVSSGRVPIGRPVVTPPVLRPENLPKRPPPRKPIIDD
jgi:hypothetical protein